MAGVHSKSGDATSFPLLIERLTKGERKTRFERWAEWVRETSEATGREWVSAREIARVTGSKNVGVTARDLKFMAERDVLDRLYSSGLWWYRVSGRPGRELGDS